MWLPPAVTCLALPLIDRVDIYKQARLAAGRLADTVSQLSRVAGPTTSRAKLCAAGHNRSTAVRRTPDLGSMLNWD